MQYDCVKHTTLFDHKCMVAKISIVHDQIENKTKRIHENLTNLHYTEKLNADSYRPTHSYFKRIML